MSDSKKIDDGGPAFPSLVDYDGQGYPSQNSGGMTLLDYFAGQALAGLSVGGGNYDAMAEDAYAMADAMIAARKAGG